MQSAEGERLSLVAMNDNTDGFHSDIVLREIHIAAKAVARAPRVLGEVVATAGVVAGQSHECHAMIVGSLEGFELPLPLPA